MKENIAGLHHIGLPTTKMDETIEFYKSLGGEVAFEKDDINEGKPIRVAIINFMGTKIEIYEREQTSGVPGSFEHIAFNVNDIDELYEKAHERGYKLMEECAESVQTSSYWPKALKWFIVYGVNGEKIEFSEQDVEL